MPRLLKAPEGATSFSYQGREFTIAEDGTIELDDDAAEAAKAHGFRDDDANETDTSEKKPRPRALPDEELAEFARRENEIIEYEVKRALGPNPTQEMRDAIALVRGHSMRLGAMLLDMPEPRARATAAGRQARSLGKQDRDKVIDAALLAEPNEAPKRILELINTKLEQFGIKTASLAHLYERRKILGLSDQES